MKVVVREGPLLTSHTGPPGDRRRIESPAPGEGGLGFGPFVLDPESGRLLDGEHSIPLAPKPFETLLYLARHPGKVVRKAELMEQLWPDTFVTEDVLVQSVVEIRRALGEDARAPRYVETIPRRGYRFIAEVRAVEPAAARSPGGPPVAAATGGQARSTRSWLAWGLGTLVALLPASYGVWRLWPGGREAISPEPGSLLVLPLAVEQPSSQDGWLRHGLAEMLRSQLGQTPHVHVIARHRVALALDSLPGYDETKGLSPEMAAVAARRLRAERLVTGSFVRVDDRFVLSAQVIDSATGRTRGAASVRGHYPGELLEGVDELAAKLVLLVGSGEAETREWRPVRLTTRSLDASRSYQAALEDFARGGRTGAEAAEARLDRALQLDPTFAQAYLKKAQIQQWRRSWGYGDPDPAPAVAAALRLVKELPDRDRRLVESFDALIVRHDPRRALELWNELLRLHPAYAEELGVPGLMADEYIEQGQWSELIRVAEAHVESPSMPESERARLCSALARAFERQGELGRALQFARRAVDGWPSGTGPRYLSERCGLGRLWLGVGDRAQALREFAAVRDAPEADATNLTQAAWGFYMAGERGEAERVVERAVAADAEYGNAYHLRGWLQLARGDYLTAGGNLETAFARTPGSFGAPHQGLVSGDLAALYYAGVAYAKGGAVARARAAFGKLVARCRQLQKAREGAGAAADWQVASYLARALARLGRPIPEPPRLEGDDQTYFVQSARLDAVRGRPDAALRELAQGVALGFSEFAHVRDDPDFESLRGNAAFERLVSEAPHGERPPVTAPPR